jgi:hypothetical protein
MGVSGIVFGVEEETEEISIGTCLEQLYEISCFWGSYLLEIGNIKIKSPTRTGTSSK